MKKFYAIVKGVCPFSGVQLYLVNECQAPDWGMYLDNMQARRAK